MEEIVERPEFEKNVKAVDRYLKGRGLDMGCGRCPLLKPDCLHIDVSPQPLAVEQVGKEAFVNANCVSYVQSEQVDYIFSSHMVEDLPTKEFIAGCLHDWSEMLKPGGYLVLVIPDMQGGRYPTVEEGANPSHRVNVGVPFIESILKELPNLKLIQMDTIPHNICSLDVVFQKAGSDENT